MYRLADGSPSTDYKVGDKFIVILTTSTFSSGSVVIFYFDDTTSAPLFKLESGHTPFDCCDGKPGAFVGWENLIPYNEIEKTFKHKKLFVLTKDGGDGSTYPQYTMDEELIEILEKLHETEVLDYEDGWSDGDGFHYDTITLPPECTPASLGISVIESDYYKKLYEEFCE